MKLIVAFLLGCAALGVCAQTNLKLTQTVPLRGVSGRFDHFAIDAKGKRLFVAALGNDTVEVIDLASPKRLKTIGHLRKPTGVLYLAEQNQIVVANGGDGTVKFFDGTSYNLVKSLGTLADADNLRFDPQTKLIYAGHGDGALAVIDAVKHERVADIKLKGHPESFQLEKKGRRIFVNVPDAKQVAVVDREKREVIAEWHWEKVEANFPMALDEANHRLFVGGRRPPWLVVADTDTGRLIKVHSISGDADDMFYDAKRKRLYLSCGQGFVDVVTPQDRDDYVTLEKVPTRSGARTSFFSEELNALYLAVPQRNGADAEIRIYMPMEK